VEERNVKREDHGDLGPKNLLEDRKKKEKRSWIQSWGELVVVKSLTPGNCGFGGQKKGSSTKKKKSRGSRGGG